jgi:protein AFG1
MQAGKKGVQDPIKLVCEELLQTSWLLCFDELQVTDIADAMILRQLFTELMDLGIVLMITSNRHPTGIGSFFYV